jgi:acylpyruvate hydrolase
MRLAALRHDGRTRAARLEGTEYVLLSTEDVGALLRAGNWRERTR